MMKGDGRPTAISDRNGKQIAPLADVANSEVNNTQSSLLNFVLNWFFVK